MKKTLVGFFQGPRIIFVEEREGSSVISYQEEVWFISRASRGTDSNLILPQQREDIEELKSVQSFLFEFSLLCTSVTE